MIDIIMKMKAQNQYVPNLQTYFVVYGVKWNQNNLDPKMYDSLYEASNEKSI